MISKSYHTFKKDLTMPRSIFAHRIQRVPRSFIREILKVAEDPEVISFAGGLPSPDLFPVARIQDALSKVLASRGPESLQYGASEGFGPLREWICQRYEKRFGLEVDPENVLITTGSQQGLDLVGKILVEESDTVVMEKPGYLGAIQALSLYTENIQQIELSSEPNEVGDGKGDGPDLEALEKALSADGCKLFYAIPNFQNPSGMSYSLEKRKAVAQLCARYGVVLLEDDPYGELRFEGTHLPPIGMSGGNHGSEGRSIMLGTLSKVAAPGLRVGWIVAPDEIMEKLLIAKQAADLHTSTFTQNLAWQYLADNDLDEHIEAIRDRYKEQARCMVRMIEDHFPGEVKFTRPQGGMFLWMTLPEGCSSTELFHLAIEKGVAFVPGEPFYSDGSGQNTMRLNFSNADEKTIEIGMGRLAGCLKDYIEKKSKI
jgi:2-aminoadipate transaminase